MEENDEELFVAVMGSPFNWEIHKAKLSKRFKLLNIKAYEGKSYLQDHLDHFNDLMELHLVFEVAKCRVFTITLTKKAKKWLKAMASELITSWQ